MSEGAAPPRDGLVWVFGYGSLMWKPGFAVEAFEPATLQGYHRSLCIRSQHWRGTAARNGLVLGLAPSRHCKGRGIGIAQDREAEVLAYLDERELVTSVYARLRLPLVLLDGTEVLAWAYVARPDHEQFAGDLPLDEIVAIVKGAEGMGGRNDDYVRNTVLHLREMGIHEPKLEAVLGALEGPPFGTDGGGI